MKRGFIAPFLLSSFQIIKRSVLKETSIYIHIPFCDHKCIYCDFYSIIKHDKIEKYFSVLKNEIKNFAEKYSNDREIISIYFGGGTPSLVEPKYIEQTINEIKKHFSLSSNPEITLETNPGTVDKTKLSEFKGIGINRLSVGIQSFNEEELKFLTRIHDAKTAIITVNDAFSVGFENLSVDLIFNLPKQTKEIWLSNLDQALALPVKHISAYSLILEGGTILNKMVLDGKVKMQGDDYDADLYESTIDSLTDKGFEQYEVSNFAQPGYQSIHNNTYWHYKDYLSFGTSAHSFAEGKRWHNYSSLNFYIEAIEKKGNAIIGEEIISQEEMLEEYIMLAMRSRGLMITEFTQKFGNEWLNINLDKIKLFEREGYITHTDNFIKFTKRGYAVCDEILTQLL